MGGAPRGACSTLAQSGHQHAAGACSDGEKRHALPSLPQFLPVLDELSIQPQVAELDPQPPRTFDSIEEAREAVARWLYVTPETDAMTRLEHVLEDALREENGAFQIEGAQPSRPNIVSWETGRR